MVQDKRIEARKQRIGKREARNGQRKRRAIGLVQVGGKPAPECQANIRTYGNIWTRKLQMNKGEVKTGHKHEFDHLHHLVRGSVQISVYDKNDREKVLFRKIYDATEDDKWIKVPKEHFHDIVAMSDGVTGYCIQALTNEDGNVVDTDYATDPDWMDEVAEFEAQNGQADETLK